MTKTLWVPLVAAWLITLGGAFRLGQSFPPGWNKAAQVALLLALHGQTLDLEEHLTMKTLKDDPESLRLWLLEKARKKTGLGVEIVYRYTTKIAADIDKHPDIWECKRREMLLSCWQPGITKIQKIRTPDPLRAPLWNLYLVSPDQARERGVDPWGNGGR